MIGRSNALQRRLMTGPAGRAVLVAACLEMLDSEVEARKVDRRVA